MPAASSLTAFGVAALAVLLVPGPSVAYVVARSLECGRTAGLLSVLGLELGLLIHVLAAAGGLAAVVATSAPALTAVKLAGAGFLVWLGVLQLRPRTAHSPRGMDRTSSTGHLIRHGLLVDLLNPKTALFVLAFLPQFVDPGRGDVGLQTLVLGLLLVALALLSDSCYAVFAGGLSPRFATSARASVRLARINGGVYLTLAALVLVT